MRDPEVYFDNPFEKGPHISDEHLRAYSELHLELLIADGRFTGLATDTLTLHEGYFGATNLEAVKGSLRQRLTFEMREEFQEFKDLVSQYEGAVKAAWGKSSAEYVQFYPQGITEYHLATLKNVEEKMTRYEAAIRAHETELPAVMVTAFLEPKSETDPGGVMVRWRASRKAQEKAKAETTASKRDAKTSRQILTVQLKRNFLAVALEVVEATETEWREALRLFPVHLLRPRGRRSDDQEAVSPATLPADGIPS